MDGAAFSDESGAKFFKNTISLHEDPPKSVGVIRVIRVMNLIPVEGDRIGDFIRLMVDIHVQIQQFQRRPEIGVELRDRLRLQIDTTAAAIARLYGQIMIYEVEVDLESSVAIRNRRRRKSTGGDVKSDAPGVIQPGTLSKANLADDLHP